MPTDAVLSPFLSSLHPLTFEALVFHCSPASEAKAIEFQSNHLVPVHWNAVVHAEKSVVESVSLGSYVAFLSAIRIRPCFRIPYPPGQAAGVQRAEVAHGVEPSFPNVVAC